MEHKSEVVQERQGIRGPRMEQFQREKSHLPRHIAPLSHLQGPRRTPRENVVLKRLDMRKREIGWNDTVAPKWDPVGIPEYKPDPSSRYMQLVRRRERAEERRRKREARRAARQMEEFLRKEQGWRSVPAAQSPGIPDYYERMRRAQVEAVARSLGLDMVEGGGTKLDDAELEYEVVEAPPEVVEMYKQGRVRAILMNRKLIALPPKQFAEPAPTDDPWTGLAQQQAGHGASAGVGGAGAGSKGAQGVTVSDLSQSGPTSFGGGGGGGGGSLPPINGSSSARERERERERGVRGGSGGRGGLAGAKSRATSSPSSRQGDARRKGRAAGTAERKEWPAGSFEVSPREESSTEESSPRSSRTAHPNRLPPGMKLYIRRRRALPPPLVGDPFAFFQTYGGTATGNPVVVACRRRPDFAGRRLREMSEREDGQGAEGDGGADASEESQERKEVTGSAEGGAGAEGTGADGAEPPPSARRSHGSPHHRTSGARLRDEAVARVYGTPQELETAAARIQSLHRGRRARREAQQMKHERQEEARAATKLQSLQRGRTTRRKVQQQQREEERAATRIQAVHRGRATRRRVREDRDAARSLGAQGVLGRPDADRAASKIQAIHRGRSTRRQLAREREAAVSGRAQEGQAASRIQALHRGRSVRKEFVKRRDEHRAALTMQRLYRGYTTRQEVKRSLLDQTGIMEAMPGITKQGSSGWYREGQDVFFFQVVEFEADDGSMDVDWRPLVGPISLEEFEQLRKRARKSEIMVAVPGTDQGGRGYYVSKELQLVYCEPMPEGHWQLNVVA